jgi:hypothetical protein
LNLFFLISLFHFFWGLSTSYGSPRLQPYIGQSRSSSTTSNSCSLDSSPNAWLELVFSGSVSLFAVMGP